MHQETLPLFDQADAEPEPVVGDGGEDRELSLDEQFEVFKAKHPDVLALFKMYAYELKAAGRTKAGGKLLAERLRWDFLTSAHGTEAPAINNNLVSRMVRWLIREDEAAFGTMFETRRLKTAGDDEDN